MTQLFIGDLLSLTGACCVVVEESSVVQELLFLLRKIALGWKSFHVFMAGLVLILLLEFLYTPLPRAPFYICLKDSSYSAIRVLFMVVSKLGLP